MCNYNMLINSDDLKLLNEREISTDLILDATENAINRIKNVNWQGVHFSEDIRINGYDYVFEAKVFYFKKKKLYKLEIEGISKVIARFNRKTGEIKEY